MLNKVFHSSIFSYSPLLNIFQLFFMFHAQTIETITMILLYKRIIQPFFEYLIIFHFAVCIHYAITDNRDYSTSRPVRYFWISSASYPNIYSFISIYMRTSSKRIINLCLVSPWRRCMCAFQLYYYRVSIPVDLSRVGRWRFWRQKCKIDWIQNCERSLF